MDLLLICLLPWLFLFSKNSFYVYMVFAYIYACMYVCCVCLVPLEVKGGVDSLGQEL